MSCVRFVGLLLAGMDEQTMIVPVVVRNDAEDRSLLHGMTVPQQLSSMASTMGVRYACVEGRYVL